MTNYKELVKQRTSIPGYIKEKLLMTKAGVQTASIGVGEVLLLVLQ
jgi:hypothetical protein